MPTYSSTEVAVLSVASVISVVFSCLSLSSFYLWYKVADTFWMKPRWSKWQMGTLCTVCCILHPKCALSMWLRVWVKEQPGKGNSDSAQRTAHFLFILVNTCLNLVWLVSLYTRMWLSYFDAKLCLELAALEWKQLIDTRERGARTNWFVANQNTWGNPSLVFKIATPLTLLFAVVMLFFTMFDYKMVNFIWAFIVFLTIGSWVLFRKKYPAFYDCIHLLEEATVIVRVSVAFVIFYVLGSAVFFWVEAKDDSVAYVLTVATRQLGNSLYVLLIQLICVNYVASFFENPYLIVFGIPVVFHLDSDSNYHSESRGEQTATRTRVMSSSPKRERQRLFSSDSDQCVNLRTVLRDDIGCRLLMSFLLSELCHENLLALIECAKFRERMADVCGVQLEATDQVLAANLFGSEVNDTQSSIVAALQSPADASQVYAALCRKYVDTASATAINVSHSTRRDAQSFVDTGSELTPFCLDPIIRQCILLLKDSFSRFSRTEQYAKFASEYNWR